MRLLKVSCLCGQNIEYPEEYAGRIANCPACGKPVTLKAQPKPSFWNWLTCVGETPPKVKTPKMPDCPTPILTAILRLVAWILFTLAAVGAAVICSNALKHDNDAFFTTLAFVPEGIAVLAGLIIYGLGDVVDYIAKTAYYTERTYRHLSKS